MAEQALHSAGHLHQGLMLLQAARQAWDATRQEAAQDFLAQAALCLAKVLAASEPRVDASQLAAADAALRNIEQITDSAAAFWRGVGMICGGIPEAAPPAGQGRAHGWTY